MAAWDRAEWNKPFPDGDKRMYSRECFRAFYTACGEREDVSNGGSAEHGLGLNPVDDAHARPACVNLSWFGGLGYLWQQITQVVGQFPVNGFASFADPTMTITAADAADGTSWDPDLNRAKLVAAVGTIRRVVPLRVGGFPGTGTDQYGQPVAVGARGHVRLPAGGGGGGTCQRVAEWTGTQWVICDPQGPARADLLDTTKGTLPPAYEDYQLDPDTGDVLTNPDTGLPYEPSSYRDTLTVGDYLGAHLWRQTRDTYNLCHRFNSVVNGRTSYSANWPALIAESATTNTTFSASSNFGQANAGSSPQSFATLLGIAHANWDVNAATPFVGNGRPFAWGTVDAFWRINPAGPFDAPANYWDGYNIRLDGQRAEAWWILRHPGYNAAAEVWVWVTKPPGGTGFDAAGTGLVENQWNQIDAQTIPAGAPVLDPNPFSGFYDYKTGSKLGDVRVGHYPPAVAPTPPPKPTLYPDPAPTYTTTKVGYLVGAPNNGTYPIGTLDYAVSGGFKYYG